MSAKRVKECVVVNKKTFSWSNKGHLGYAIEELTRKGQRRTIYYEEEQHHAEAMVQHLNEIGHKDQSDFVKHLESKDPEEEKGKKEEGRNAIIAAKVELEQAEEEYQRLKNQITVRGKEL